MNGPTWALRTNESLDEVNRYLPVLEAAGLLGIDEAQGRATLWFSSPPADQLPVAGTWEEVPDTDWNAAWRASIEPVVVGRIVVVPPWWTDPPAAEDGSEAVVLRIEPAQAFGTGHHDTTVGCLRALQDRKGGLGGVELEGARVLDVGTGTGVLAIAALRLGAASAAGVDVDAVAVATARDNAAANLADPATFTVADGSVDAVPAQPYDIVLANLDTATLSALSAPIAAAVAPTGVLIASGVSVERIGEATDALEAAGLAVTSEAAGLVVTSDDQRVAAADVPDQAWALLRGEHARAGPALPSPADDDATDGNDRGRRHRPRGRSRWAAG